MYKARKEKRVLAIASGGGHWVQLLRLRPAFERCDIAYVTVQPSYADQVAGHRFYTVTDATRWSRWSLLKMIVQVAMVVVKERPDVVVTTGAAPGFVGLRIASWIGAKTIWLDSIANVECVSMSGEKAGGFVDLWLTQWEHLARERGPDYKGAVL